MPDKPFLGVILVSSRPNRAGEPVTRWFEDVAATHGAFEIQHIDLREIALPLIDEPEHPRLQKYMKAHTKRWSAIVQSCDAFVAVTPEYNYGAPPTLINAFDYVYVEWNYKPIGFVSYGGISGGTRSVQMSKQIATTLKMMPIPEQVTIPFVNRHIDDERKFTPSEGLETQANAMLSELARWEAALRGLR